jgi:hypothetical protein
MMYSLLIILLFFLIVFPFISFIFPLESLFSLSLSLYLIEMANISYSFLVCSFLFF